jgi:hypothetical protein
VEVWGGLETAGAAAARLGTVMRTVDFGIGGHGLRLSSIGGTHLCPRLLDFCVG